MKLFKLIATAITIVAIAAVITVVVVEQYDLKLYGMAE